MPYPFMSRAQAREFAGVRIRFGFWVCVVVLLAFLIREYFVLATIIDIPIRGDIREYVLYAWNLYHHGVFSMAPPQGAALPIPDAYRSPGYPWLLALCMYLRPQSDGWYGLALQMQVLLGTATVWLTVLLGRRWLGQGWALAAGTLLALWPHHVAATGALLSEVAFGFTLMAGLYYFAKAMEDRHRGFIALAAATFGYAYLINPLIALFPPVLALVAWRKKGRATALLFFGIFLLPVLAWSLRNVQLDQASADQARPGRAVVNFVQGSWPQYHGAWQASKGDDPGGKQIMSEIGRETRLLNESVAAGLPAIGTRFRQYPLYYGLWYAWRKPWLLWSWDIQLGYSGVYVLEVRYSPLDTNPLLRASTLVLKGINPLLSLLALSGAAWALMGGLSRKPRASIAAVATAALAFYLTAIHVVFQAEPRYANAYRGIEMLLIMSMLKVLLDTWRRWKAGDRGGSPSVE